MCKLCRQRISLYGFRFFSQSRFPYILISTFAKCFLFTYNLGMHLSHPNVMGTIKSESSRGRTEKRVITSECVLTHTTHRNHRRTFRIRLSTIPESKVGETPWIRFHSIWNLFIRLTARVTQMNNHNNNHSACWSRRIASGSEIKRPKRVAFATAAFAFGCVFVCPRLHVIHICIRLCDFPIRHIRIIDAVRSLQMLTSTCRFGVCT